MRSPRNHRAPFCFTLVDQAGRVQYQSSGIKDLAGYRAQDLDGKPWLSLVHQEDAPTVTENFGRLVAQEGASASWVLRVRQACGTWRAVEVHACNLLSDPDVAGVLLRLKATGARAGERRTTPNPSSEALR